jgi:RNA 2',3'-cyclic 3'-phosphodiesterase
MTLSDTVGGDERLRLFCALTLPDDTLDRLVAWQEAELRGGGRLVPRANLHITVAFIGSRPAEEVAHIAQELRAAVVEAHEPIRLRSTSYRETRSVGMVVFADEDRRATSLAAEVHTRLEELRVYRRERRPWLPHVTTLRFRRPPRLHAPPPDLGAFSPSGAAVYHSVLRSGGAQYKVLESVSLGG